MKKFLTGLGVGGFVMNLLMFVIVAYPFFLWMYSPEFLFQSAQEDEYVEWATFFSFIAASGIFLKIGISCFRHEKRLLWYVLGLASFCFFVAMEEISWAQRVFGYLPPEYFLQNNFQQEFNLHNVASVGFRAIVLQLIICGYGIVLPVLGKFKSIADKSASIGVVLPPLTLAPSFVAIYLLYYFKPVPLATEWVELLLGLGFMFSALSLAPVYESFGDAESQAGRSKSTKWKILGIAGLWALVLGLGFAAAQMSRIQQSLHPGNLAAARAELNAIKTDLGLVLPFCNMHMRVYNYANQFDTHELKVGSYRALQLQGLPEERAEYFIDPWGMSYRFKGDCFGDNEYFYIYSFGPNRMRDSYYAELEGDDIGVYLFGGK